MGREQPSDDWQIAYKAPTHASDVQEAAPFSVGKIKRNDNIPVLCPNCGTAFSTLRRPKRRMQRKAMLIAAIGFLVFAIVSLAVGIMLLMVAPGGSVRLSIGLSIFAMLAGSFASRPLFKAAVAFPFVTKMRCKRCGWDGCFYTTVNNSILTPSPIK